MLITVSAIRRASCFTLATFLAFLLFCSTVSAQADPGMYKTQSLSAFAGFLYDHQDFSGGYNDGVMFGLNLTQHIHFPVEPSLEARVNIAPGDDLKQNSYLFGPVLSARVGPFHPYGDFMVGIGTINFNHPTDPTYTHDDSTVYSGGGGVEVNLIRDFRLKFDLQYQHWELGGGSRPFSPVLASAGLSYTVPFRPFHKHSDPNYR